VGRRHPVSGHRIQHMEAFLPEQTLRLDPPSTTLPLDLLKAEVWFHPSSRRRRFMESHWKLFPQTANLPSDVNDLDPQESVARRSLSNGVTPFCEHLRRHSHLKWLPDLVWRGGADCCVGTDNVWIVRVSYFSRADAAPSAIRFPTLCQSRPKPIYGLVSPHHEGISSHR
jgi:hypothetical protein